MTAEHVTWPAGAGPIVCLGAHVPGLFVEVERVPSEGETVIGTAISEPVDGGKSTCQAIAAARLGAPVVFVSVVGSDERGRRWRGLLDAEGIDTRWLQTIEGATDEAMTMLKGYSWPGNVRELRNVIERSVVLAKGEWIEENDLPPYVRNPSLRPEKLVFAVGETTVADAERELILKTLERAGNNKAEAARQLGVDVKTIYNKLKSYGIEA